MNRRQSICTKVAVFQIKLTIFAGLFNKDKKMKISKIISLTIIAACVMAAVSCKKDDDSTALPSLGGTLSFYAPLFIEPGQTLTMTPSGVEHPADKGLGYYWTVAPVMDDMDTTRLENGLSPEGLETDGSFTYTFPDSLAVYIVRAYAFAEGYTGKSGERYVTTVKPGLDGSLTNTGIKASDAHITVDGQDYYYHRIGDLEWFRNNVARKVGGAPYSNAEIMTNVFGRFYNYEDALKACPEGWRLPTEEDWIALGAALNASSEKYGTVPGVAARLMADSQFNGVTMWEYWPEVGSITNESKFSAVPAGYMNLGEEVDGAYPEANSYGVYEYAAFWTADSVEDDDAMAYYRYIVANQPDLFITKGDKKNFGASVRCVRDVKNSFIIDDQWDKPEDLQ